jgi:hypothetical protein
MFLDETVKSYPFCEDTLSHKTTLSLQHDDLFPSTKKIYDCKDSFDDLVGLQKVLYFSFLQDFINR